MNTANLDPNDFELLGSFYTHDSFEINAGGGVVSIVPKQYCIRRLLIGLAVMTLVSAPLFGLAVWAGLERGIPPLLVVTALTPFWLLAVVGPIAFVHYRSRHLATCSPLIARELDSGIVTVRGSAQQHTRNEIVCLVALAMPNDEHRLHGEIQLVTRKPNSNSFDRSLARTYQS